MKTKVTTWLIALATCLALNACLGKDAQEAQTTTLYDFTVVAHDGEEVSLDKYRGKVVLVVNTASQCRFSPQYADLERIYENYVEDGFEILDFPCNQFGNQSPETDAETAIFCQQNYGTKFSLFKKIEVNGDREIPLYTWLKSQKGFAGYDKSHPMHELDSMMREANSDYDKTFDIKWNFTKFLIDRKGNVLARFEPTDSMQEVEAAIVEALQQDE